jgi:phosphohistidine phosphatase SixA
MAVRHPEFDQETRDPVVEPLTSTGHEQAASVAERLYRDLVGKPIVIVHSCALRTQQLANAIGAQFGIVPRPAGWTTHGPIDMMDLVASTRLLCDTGAIIACVHKPCIQKLLDLAGHVDPTPIAYGDTFTFLLDLHLKTLIFKC